ncbi:MAG: phosphoesterase RecJ domain-containing protein, partial [Candidatus Berkelbacteria bacterium Licking1014_2]
LFYETPVINIDHHSANDYFGKVNWVDLTATSTAEILVSLLESLSRETNILDEDIATCLLAGIVVDTNSFQSISTTPKSLTVAAQLVAAGGRQQQIIDCLYRTKPLSALKLWGRILSNIQEEKDHRFIWSFTTLADLQATGAKETEINQVVQELMQSAPDIDFVLLLSERAGNYIQGNLLSARRNINVANLAKLFGGSGYEHAAIFRLTGGDFNSIVKKVLAELKKVQSTRILAPAGD